MYGLLWKIFRRNEISIIFICMCLSFTAYSLYTCLHNQQEAKTHAENGFGNFLGNSLEKYKKTVICFS